MNGKLNLFIRCFICFCAYFYSVSAYAVPPMETSYITSAGTINLASTKTTIQSIISTCVITNLKPFAIQPNFINYASWDCENLGRYSNGALKIYQCAPDTEKAGVKTQYSNFDCGLSTAPTPVPTVAPTTTPVPKDCTSKAAKSAGQLIWSLNSAGDNKGDTCSGGCRANASDYKCGVVAGKTYCTGSSTYTGGSCTGTENPNADSQTESPQPTTPPNTTPVPPPPNPAQQKADCIAAGKSFGEVNGQIICVKASPDAPATETKTSTTEKTNPDGSKTTSKTETTTTDSGTGKVKTDTTTTTSTPEGGTRPDGSPCTTPGGCTDVEGEGKEESKDDFCKENPKAKQCQDHNKEFSASCTNFKCANDDPATCEIARLQWQTICEEKKQIEELTESNLFKDGEEILKGKLDDDSLIKLGLTGDNNTIDITDTFKDSKNGFLSCSRGLSDKNVRVMGKSFVIPFSKMNPFLEIMGKIAVIFTMVVAARIIVGGVK